MRAESQLAIQIRVVIALIIREMVTRYGRSAGGYVWALLEPVATIALLSFIFSQITRHPQLGTNFPFYFATAYLPFHIYLDISRSVSSAVQANRSLLNFPRITMFDTIIARFFLQFFTSILVFSVISVGIILIFNIPVNIDLFAVFFSIFMAASLGLGIGSFNCVLFAFSPTWQRVFGIINRPLVLISGIFFNFESLPANVRDLLWWNPLIHVTAMMRTGFFAEYHANFVTPSYVLAIALASLMVGILLLRVLRVHVLEIIDT